MSAEACVLLVSLAAGAGAVVGFLCGLAYGRPRADERTTMTARETLREVADALDPEVPRPAYDGEGNAQRAAALRVLADRLDQALSGRGGPVLAAMRRLDADLAPSLQKEPR